MTDICEEAKAKCKACNKKIPEGKLCPWLHIDNEYCEEILSLNKALLDFNNHQKEMEKLAR